MNSILVHPESFLTTPRLNFQIVPTWSPRGFGIGFANPRVSLHHSCAACMIVAAPGVIKSGIPAGIFVVPVTCNAGSSLPGLYHIMGTSGTLAPVLAKPKPRTCREGSWCGQNKAPIGAADIITPDKRGMKNASAFEPERSPGIGKAAKKSRDWF